AQLTDWDCAYKVTEALHPTPALCGYPKEAAQTFILENEGYERAYYGGYLGEWNFGGTDADRKSTRLNSSHVKISYADFCLKKIITAQHSPVVSVKGTILMGAVRRFMH